MSDFRVHSPALHSHPPDNNERSEVTSIEASLMDASMTETMDVSIPDHIHEH